MTEILNWLTDRLRKRVGARDGWAGWLGWLILILPGTAQELTQTFNLRPGWNAVWLETDPADRSPSSVFAGTPVASVWTYSERISATDFIQNPESTGWNRAKWLAYFPTNSPEARLANLYAILPQRAYLIRLPGSNSVPWTVTGRPTLQPPAWAADRYNLRGFPIDPAHAPSFREFFRPSPAHFAAGSDRLEAVFRLNPDGQWQAVAGDEPMQRGEAYWVYTRGPSDFVAPFSLGLNSGEAIDFDAVRRRVELTLRNHQATTKTIRIEPGTPQVSPLLLVSPSGGDETRPLVSHDQPVASGGTQRLRLGLDRTQLPGSPATNPSTGRHLNLLSISDGEGTLYHVGVVALAGPASDYTGLWLGTVTITNVSPTLGSTNGPGTPGAVALGFPLRLLLHVDSGGQVSLLRDVTLVYTRTNSIMATNGSAGLGGRLLTQLVTDPARLARYTASDLQSGLVSGRRLTAPHFEFARTNGQFSLPLAGVFALSNAVSGTLSLPGNLPTNPFLHRYHPDHSTNAYAVTRDINLLFGANPNPDPGQGDETLGGMYWETLTGLQKQPLYTSGSFQLQRIADLGELNTETP